MLEDIHGASAFHGIAEAEFFGLGAERLTGFVDAMPSIRIDTHLRLQWVRNQQLKTRLSDLNDFGYVGNAHRDVVVLTKTNSPILLNRDKNKKATVISALILRGSEKVQASTKRSKRKYASVQSAQSTRKSLGGEKS